MAPVLSAALAALLVALPAAGADTPCRATTLGSQRCAETSPRPMPRPAIRSDTSALERVRDRPDQELNPTTFVPAVRRNRLGTTIIDAPGPIGTCREDALGNLRCR